MMHMLIYPEFHLSLFKFPEDFLDFQGSEAGFSQNLNSYKTKKLVDTIIYYIQLLIYLFILYLYTKIKNGKHRVPIGVPIWVLQKTSFLKVIEKADIDIA